MKKNTLIVEIKVENLLLNFTLSLFKKEMIRVKKNKLSKILNYRRTIETTVTISAKKEKVSIKAKAVRLVPYNLSYSSGFLALATIN